ncbi:MAG: DUF3095 domain-containing protein [bacterium]|nr:DUF3095 domain-containing protein [bacterium]
MKNNWYTSLPTCASFRDSLMHSAYCAAPDDWFVVITDIKGSTKHVEAGRYKEANTVGAASIMAILNALKGTDIPFVFGGDGASILIPENALPSAKRALRAAQELAERTFAMELRVGIVPMHEVHKAGKDVLIAKFAPSKHYTQTMFAGDGLSYAESLIKDPHGGERYALEQTIEPIHDFSGLSCKWQDIKSKHSETITLLVRARPTDPMQAQHIYQDIFGTIEDIYGGNDLHHPITTKELRFVTSGPATRANADIHTLRLSAPMRVFHRLNNTLMLKTLALADWLKIPLPRLNLMRIKQLIIETADYKKFDDTLRMVIAGTPAQRVQLEKHLDDLTQQGDIFYGLHVSDRALMTCIVFEHYGKQVHFIDGADGGYTKAAIPLKKQLKAHTS